MPRKLASIRKISEIKPIKGADLIELAVVDGWQVVVKKDDFKVGQEVVYFEIDSFLPEKPEYEFLRKSSGRTMDGIFGYRLRTIKLRGEISQGLILSKEDCKIKGIEGDDVTDKLGVQLYEVTRNNFTIGKKYGRIQSLFYRVKAYALKYFPKARATFDFLDKLLFNTKFLKPFPSYIQKTDAERIQNLTSKLDEFRKYRWEVTVKLDGSSMTVFHKDGETGVCFRNLDITEEDNNYTRTEKKYGILEALKKYKHNIAIQGELIGEGIQKNNEKIEGQDFYVFSIYDIDNHKYFNALERREILQRLKSEYGCELKHVPVVEEYFNLENMTLEDLLKLAEGKSLFGKEREGLVFKSIEVIGQNVQIFKVISNKYLLKNEC